MENKITLRRIKRGIVKRFEKAKLKYLCEKSIQIGNLVLDSSHWRVKDRSLYPMREEQKRDTGMGI
jgi:hypothetical protein